MNKKIVVIFTGLFWVIIALGFIFSKQHTLETGKPIVLATVPVDPRDLLRGDYIVLRYKISTLDLKSIESFKYSFKPGEVVYVTLAPRGKFWEAVSVKANKDQADIALRGKVDYYSYDKSLHLTYGLESYFVPEGEGKDLERRMRGSKTSVAVEALVDDSGRAIIKRVYVIPGTAEITPQQTPAPRAAKPEKLLRSEPSDNTHVVRSVPQRLPKVEDRSGEKAQARDGNEEVILAILNEKGKEFYFKSKKIRDGYASNHPYKHFLLIGYGLDEMDEEGYFHHSPGATGYVPNPALYSDIPEKRPDQFYRYVKDCATKETIQRQVLDTTTGYANFIGRDRYNEQCIGDGSFDNYYVESATKLE